MLQRLIRILFPLRDFRDKEELDRWYEKHKGLSLPYGNHCDDHSLEARSLAEKDGYKLSLCLVFQGKVYFTQIYYKEDGTPNTEMYHVANLARVIQGKNGTSELWLVDLNWQKLVFLTDFLPGGKYAADNKSQSLNS